MFYTGENNKLLYEYKFKLKKAEQEIITLQNTVSRVEMQVERYKKQLEQAEKSEDELKTDKRKILREVNFIPILLLSS